jgi:hypothetical protein
MGPDLLQKMEWHGTKTVLCNKDDNLKPILQFWPGDTKRMLGKQPWIKKITVFWYVMPCCFA